MDKAPFAPCRPPQVYKLEVGKHTFRVAAVDAAGTRDPSPARFALKVVGVGTRGARATPIGFFAFLG